MDERCCHQVKNVDSDPTAVALYGTHFVTEYALSDNSGEQVNLTVVDCEKDLAVKISSDLCIALCGICGGIRYESSFYDQKGICYHLKRAICLSLQGICTAAPRILRT